MDQEILVIFLIYKSKIIFWIWYFFFKLKILVPNNINYPLL